MIESPQGIINYDYSPVTGRKLRTWTGDTYENAVSINEYAYDPLGRLSAVTVTKRDGQTLAAPEVTGYTYDENGNRKSMTLPNGVYTEYTYNVRNQLTNLTHYEDDTKTTEISDFEYGLYADGMRATADESLNEERKITYQYDVLNRIIQEDNYTASAPYYGYTASYEYDNAGNRLSRSVQVTNSSGTYTLNTTYIYDLNTDRLLSETNTEPVTAIPYGDKQYAYAYANSGGGMTYQLPNSKNRIGQFGAFLLGLPSVWNRVLFYTLMILIPVLFFAPVFIRRRDQLAPDVKLWHRMLCVLLAYIFLVGPEAFHMLAHADTQYSDLTTASWGSGNCTIEYDYDANGSMTKKTTKQTLPEQILEVVDYTYNLQNRLAQAATTPYSGGSPGTPEVVDYTYNPSGIRVQKVIDDTCQTDYLVDPSNHTGYAQVLEECTCDMTDSQNPVLDEAITYTIGDDIISQSSTVSGIKHLLYDGHGSARQLVNPDKSVHENYAYDAYGVMLGDTTTPKPAQTVDTNLLYSGEQYDKNMDEYYLRARYYNQNNGTFNRVDPYSGNLQDPQSLHKYLYVHNNPVNSTDPMGLFSLSELMLSVSIYVMLRMKEIGPKVATGLWIAIKITAAMWLAALTTLIFMALGVIPHDEYVAEIAAILGYVLIMELMVYSMLPDSWRYPSTPTQQSNDPRPRGMHDPRVKKAVEVGNEVHYDKLTDPSKYNHEGGPSQLQRRYPNTDFWFAKRGQSGVDVRVLGGKHPSTYPNSTWPSGINQADFKPDTPTGNAFKLPANTLRITYDPQTGQINH